MIVPRETLPISFVHSLLPSRSCRECKRPAGDPGSDLCRPCVLVESELDMVGLLGMTEDNAIEAAVIFELCQHGEAQTFRIHLSCHPQIVGWPGYSHRKTRFHNDRLKFSQPTRRKLPGQAAVYPPSIVKIAPVQYEDSSLPRNAASLATSSLTPYRCIAMFAFTAWRTAAGSAGDI
jgi:hypothetical protein